jgi:hypothetical protein
MRAKKATGATTAETSFYTPLDNLLNEVGKTLKPRVVFSTQVSSNASTKQPDGGFFPVIKVSKADGPLIGQRPERGVVEIKPAGDSLADLARSNQIATYLRDFGLVLITNYHQFLLVRLNPSGTAETFEPYTLTKTDDDFWNLPLAALATKHKDTLPDYLARVLVYKVPIERPKDLAWLLASYAREAKVRAEDHPLASFRTVKSALEESLGITFDGDKGENFFISTLIQTLFYGIFSAWILWRRSDGARPNAAPFNWRQAAWYLRIPVLRQLFNTVAEPGGLNAVTLTEVLDLAGDALNRVQPGFFATFREEDAVNYFYEPFLEAFDPQLRKELGVWYTPREIVHYMVERVDHLLRTELNQPDGLASPNVRVLDPCCGTGAYLVAVLQRIHRTLLEKAGDDTAYVPGDLRTAATTRIFGFEIMPAPFVIAHLQLAALLEDSGAPLAEADRAQVFLTNALTGWIPERHPQSVLSDEFIREREAAEGVKQQGSILVILGNPPYNGYAGIARMDEERDLTNAYREQLPGLAAPQGQGLNDLYIRFFRIAERRIVGDANVSGNPDHTGIISFISNNAWLDGLSQISMRGRYLQTFQSIYIDNLNGDSRRTGKTTPDGKPDPSAFSTPQNREGIQVGTAIATLVRNTTASVAPIADADIEPSAKGAAHHSLGRRPRLGDREAPRAESPTHSLPANASSPVRLRDLWGTTKLSQLESESRREMETAYELLQPVGALGLPFAKRLHSANYTSWPRLPDLFQVSFPGIQTGRDALLVDIDRDRLEERMGKYLDPLVSDSEIAQISPDAMQRSARFEPTTVRATLVASRKVDLQEWQETQENVTPGKIAQKFKEMTAEKVVRFCYRPFDIRWLYWEGRTKLLDEKREDYVEAFITRTPTIVSSQANRRSYDPPYLTTDLACRHVTERGGNSFPAWYHYSNLPGQVDMASNTSDLVDDLLSSNNGDPIDLFPHALAIMHTPSYGAENAGALLGDWPRIPIPVSASLLSNSAKLGLRLAKLLDPESPVQFAAEWSFLARLGLPTDSNLAENLTVTAGWGFRGQGSTVMPGRGKSPEREWYDFELEKLSALAAAQSVDFTDALALLGDTCVDVYLNDGALWNAVPIKVWEYTLGGYQVLKKWLSYRELPLLGRPLHEDEAKYFAQVVRRITAILLMGPALDASYAAILPTATGLQGAPNP